MTALSTRRRWFRSFVIGMLLIFTLGGMHVASQVSSSFPSRAQVIAQGSQDIIDQPMQWQVRFATVDSVTRNMPYIFNGGFVFAPDKQLLVARDGIEASLLSLGQAMFASARVDHLVYSAADVESGLMTVALVPVGSTDTGALTTPFTLAPGSYNLQFTSGIMAEGEVNTFQPQNDAYYLFMLAEGQVSITQDGSTAATPVEAGEFMEWTDAIGITASAPGETRYLIASVGDVLPDLPKGTGNLTVYYYECDGASFSALSYEDCYQIRESLNGTLTLTMGADVTVISTDIQANITDDNGWEFTDLQSGDWRFSLADESYAEGANIAVVGDASRFNDEWWMEVRSGQDAEAHVLLNFAIEDASLSVVFAECPSWWTADDGLGDCFLVAEPPYLEFIAVYDDDVVFSIDWDGVTDEPGIYQIYDMPEGLYRLYFDFYGDWTEDNTVFGWDAWYEEGEYWVEVIDYSPQAVLVVLQEDEWVVEPPPSGTGSVVVEQLECSPTQNDPGCSASQNTWEVYFTSDEVPAVYILTIDGEYLGDGLWRINLPDGGYWVDAVADDLYVEFTPWVDVYSDQESYVQIRVFDP